MFFHLLIRIPYKQSVVLLPKHDHVENLDLNLICNVQHNLLKLFQCKKNLYLFHTVSRTVNKCEYTLKQGVLTLPKQSHRELTVLICGIPRRVLTFITRNCTHLILRLNGGVFEFYTLGKLLAQAMVLVEGFRHTCYHGLVALHLYKRPISAISTLFQLAGRFSTFFFIYYLFKLTII